MLRRLALALLMTVSLGVEAVAHETDQFTVPVGMEFADLGDHFNRWAYDTIEAAVNKTNERIHRALQANRPASEIAHLQSPHKLTAAVFNEFQSAYVLIESLEHMTKSKAMMRRYPGRLIGYETQLRNIYQHVHFPLDPRQVFRLWHASTLKVYGTYLGTDKIGHFTDMGYHYYKAYRRARRNGASEAEALRRAVRVGTDGLLISETGLVGILSAGAYSNADLAANYAGLKFYLNLTQTTRIKGVLYKPMVSLGGDYWRLDRRVRRDGDFFRIFISDHYNEALNPSRFETGMRKAVRKAVHKRADSILQWYADDNGNTRPRAYFDRLVDELATHYGEDYGHRGSYDELISIGNTCFDLPPSPNQINRQPPADEVALYWAALQGDGETARRVLDRGVNIDGLVVPSTGFRGTGRETALHVAAAAGQGPLVELLLSRGAHVNAIDHLDAAPLHRALEHPSVVDILISYGANVNVKDSRGRTPLHWVARYPNLRTIEMLLADGADVNATDHHGETPLHRATLWGHLPVIQLLLGHGAEVNARADFNTTPLHFAVCRGHFAAIEILIASRARLDAADEFGWTALHDAAARGQTRIADLLVQAGADLRASDDYGSTPLHQAARHGHTELAALLLNAGADVNARSDLGSTPLHEAACAGNNALVNLLLGRGASTDTRNAKGRSPFDLASANGNAFAAAAISTHGSNDFK